MGESTKNYDTATSSTATGASARIGSVGYACVPQASAYQRFNVFQRLEHILLLVSFTVLGVTGLPQKYSAQPWATTMIGAMGGIETTRLIHR